MKYLFITLLLLSSMNSFATIEAMPGDETEPTAKEVYLSQSCFHESESFGCGHPKDDAVKFRSCINSVYTSLSHECRKMITELYGNKKMDPAH